MSGELTAFDHVVDCHWYLYMLSVVCLLFSFACISGFARGFAVTVWNVGRRECRGRESVNAAGCFLLC
jgi:hypothetical protein